MRKKVKEPEVVYRCNPTYYKGDRPHWWHFVTDLPHYPEGFERYYMPPKGKSMGKPKMKLCEDHSKKPTFLTPAMLAEGIKLPGFEHTVSEEKWSDERYPIFQTTGDGVTIKIMFVGGDKKASHWYEKLSSSDSQATGHVEFTSSHGIRSFDRTGVEDSFYLTARHDVTDVQKILEQQLARVAKSRAALVSMENIPGLPYLLDPSSKATIIEHIKGRGHSFTPSGFGTGYHLYHGRQRDRYDKRAKPETEKYFGLEPIYIQEMDCD